MKLVWTYTWRAALAGAVLFFIVTSGSAGPFSGSTEGPRIGGALVLAAIAGGMAAVCGAAVGCIVVVFQAHSRHNRKKYPSK